MKELLSILLVFVISQGISQELPDKENLWVYVMAGQSNMAGRGVVEPQDTVTNARIWTINKELGWVLAKEPLHFYEPKMVGLDCGLSFAKELLKSVPANVSIAVIPCAVGGSSVEQWLGDSTHRDVPLMSNFKEKVKFAQEYGLIKGIIWHQGESNANLGSLPTFPSHLLQLFHNFRDISGNIDLPIVMGEIGAFAQPKTKAKNWKALNGELKEIAKKEDNTFLITTKDLMHKGDNVHFDSASQRIIGKRYANEFIKIYKN
ncbi:protein of unknown function [Spirosomataceae bacterium TFI 002]|nr:protein of unknown function [Spirosomataceae bacterium TFI 002]